MSRPKNKKINHLLAEWPRGVILTSNWLKNKGYYKQLVKRYCDNGWIRSLGRGAYARLSDEITWAGAVKALQSQLDLSVHLGGLSALQLYGITQYVELGDSNSRFYLFNSTEAGVRLPVWFTHYFSNCHVEQKKLFQNRTGLSKKTIDGIELNVASPERAVMETLALVPKKITLSHANELMEGLDRLRVKLVQQLLEECLSIKVKRLFLYLAESNNLSFFSELNIKVIELGSGKRVIAEGGAYNPKWQLSLPKANELNDQYEGGDE